MFHLPSTIQWLEDAAAEDRWNILAGNNSMPDDVEYGIIVMWGYSHKNH